MNGKKDKKNKPQSRGLFAWLKRKKNDEKELIPIQPLLEFITNEDTDLLETLGIDAIKRLENLIERNKVINSRVDRLNNILDDLLVKEF